MWRGITVNLLTCMDIWYSRISSYCLTENLSTSTAVRWLTSVMMTFSLWKNTLWNHFSHVLAKSRGVSTSHVHCAVFRVWHNFYNALSDWLKRYTRSWVYLAATLVNCGENTASLDCGFSVGVNCGRCVCLSIRYTFISLNILKLYVWTELYKRLKTNAFRRNFDYQWLLSAFLVVTWLWPRCLWNCSGDILESLHVHRSSLVDYVV